MTDSLIDDLLFSDSDDALVAAVCVSAAYVDDFFDDDEWSEEEYLHQEESAREESTAETDSPPTAAFVAPSASTSSKKRGRPTQAERTVDVDWTSQMLQTVRRLRMKQDRFFCDTADESVVNRAWEWLSRCLSNTCSKTIPVSQVKRMCQYLERTDLEFLVHTTPCEDKYSRKPGLREALKTFCPDMDDRRSSVGSVGATSSSNTNANRPRLLPSSTPAKRQQHNQSTPKTSSEIREVTPAKRQQQNQPTSKTSSETREVTPAKRQQQNQPTPKTSSIGNEIREGLISGGQQESKTSSGSGNNDLGELKELIKLQVAQSAETISLLREVLLKIAK